MPRPNRVTRPTTAQYPTQYPQPQGKQRVHLGVTQRGTTGFFTGNCLAISLAPAEYSLASRDPLYAQHLADRFNFQFVA